MFHREDQAGISVSLSVFSFPLNWPPLQLGSLPFGGYGSAKGVVHPNWIIKQLLVSGSKRCTDDMSGLRKTDFEPLCETDEET